MTIRLIFWIFASFTLSVGVMVGLLALSKDIRERPGSFLRQYPPHPAIESKLIELEDEHYYFAGATKSKIYLANTVNPLKLLEVNSDMSDTSIIGLNLGIAEKLKFFRITVTIDSPYFYFMDGAVPYMYRGTIRDWKAELFMKDSIYFIDAVPLSSHSFAVCAFSPKTKEKALGKMRVNPKAVKLNHTLLERQFDGLFDVDGSLTYDKELNRLIYVYYYRNEYIVIDSNLNLDYRGNTIDTFKIAQVKAAEVYSEKAIKLSAPPLITNKSHAAYGHWLFVHSLLPAKNEDMKRFAKSSTIDVYNLNSNSYEFSFHVFDEDGEKINNFIVVNRRLYALYNHSLRSFDLTEYYFPK